MAEGQQVPVCHGPLPADADAQASGGGDIAPADLMEDGVDRAAPGGLQHPVQILLRQGPPAPGGMGPLLPPPAHRQGEPLPQAQFFNLPPALPVQLGQLGPEKLGEHFHHIHPLTSRRCPHCMRACPEKMSAGFIL